MQKKVYLGNAKSVKNIVTGDCTWIYSHEPESKQKSTVFVLPDEPNPCKSGSYREAFYRKSFFCYTGHVKAIT